MADWRYYDDFTLKEHIQTQGCLAPYQNSLNHFSTCKTKEEIKKSVYDLTVVKNRFFPQPCQSLSKVEFKFVKADQEGQGDEFVLDVSFPDQVKMITQSRSVDVHALLGNIGGYIGLFLGTKNQLKEI